MKIPLTWLQDYVVVNDPAKRVADDFTVIGLMLDKPIEDGVLDLEQRLNRVDLLSILGCARDYAAFKKLPLKIPKLSKFKLFPADKDSKINIRVDTSTVRRFNTRVIKGLKVGKSPKWLKERLEAYGMESKNNLVDITNFVMLELGQPLHAQDLAKLPAPELHLRESRVGESITTLLGTEVSLPEGIFVISSGDTLGVIGGIVGGVHTGVNIDTREIILDAGNYDQRVIRRNSRRLKIANETVARYDKFLDPRLTEFALDRATELILELCGGTAYENQDYYPTQTIPQTLALTYARLEKISGMSFTAKQIKDILGRLGYQILREDSKHLLIEVPVWRTDLDVEDDLISDILRMSNYNTIPQMPLSTPLPRDLTSVLYHFEQELRTHLTSLGLHEHLTSPLVSADNNPQRVKLENALSSQENALRLDLIETLETNLNSYRKHNLTDTALFEIGKSFSLNQKSSVIEHHQLTVASCIDVRAYLTSLLRRLGITFQLLPTTNSEQVSIQIGKTSLGTLTKNHFTLDTSLLQAYVRPYQNVVSDLSPITTLDLSLNLPPDLSFSTIEQNLRKASPSLLSIKVMENLPTKRSLLIRLGWSKLKNPDKTRLSLVKALKDLGVESRSG